METRLAIGVINRWTPVDPCQGQTEPPPVPFQEQQVTSSDSLRGQSAMPRVPAQQIESDDEATAFFLLQNLLSLTRNTMSESGPRWLQVATPLVTARVGQLAQNDISTCLVFSRSIARAPETRFSQDLVAVRLPAVGRRKFPFALAFTAERGDIHHLSGTVESWELRGDGPFLFPIDAQAKLGLIKDMAKTRTFIENKPGFNLRMYKDAKTGLMLINVADFDLLNDQA